MYITPAVLWALIIKKNKVSDYEHPKGMIY